MSYKIIKERKEGQWTKSEICETSNRRSMEQVFEEAMKDTKWEVVKVYEITEKIIKTAYPKNIGKV